MDDFTSGFVAAIIAVLVFNFLRGMLAGWNKPVKAYRDKIKVSVDSGKIPSVMARDAFMGRLKTIAFWFVVLLFIAGSCSS